MPPGFQYPTSTELWTPLTAVPEAANDRAYRYLRVMARLKPGVTLQEAQVEMNTIASRLAREYPKTNKDEDATKLITLREVISGDIRPSLVVLLCAAGFVLLIACTNVANLLLARGASRRREVVVRAALGASRSRLIRQFLTESMLLGIAGGGFGLLLASPCTRALVTMFPPTIFNLNIPHVEKIPIDGWVLGSVAAVSLLTGVTFGLVPALQAGRPGTYESLNASGRSLAGSAQGRRFPPARGRGSNPKEPSPSTKWRPRLQPSAGVDHARYASRIQVQDGRSKNCLQRPSPRSHPLASRREGCGYSYVPPAERMAGSPHRFPRRPILTGEPATGGDVEFHHT